MIVPAGMDVMRRDIGERRFGRRAGSVSLIEIEQDIAPRGHPDGRRVLSHGKTAVLSGKPIGTRRQIRHGAFGLDGRPSGPRSWP